MRAVAATLSVAAVLLCASAGSASDAAAFDPGPAIHQAVEQHFGHWDPSRRAAFARAWAAYRAAEPHAAGDRDAVDLAAMRLVASLRNHHSGYFDNAFFESRPWNAPFDLQFVEGAWIVTGSRTPSVRDGARLVSVGGVPAAAYFAQHADLIYASSAYDAHAQMLGAIYAGTPARGVARLRFDDGVAVALDNASSWKARKTERVATRWLVPGRIAYVAIPSFDDPKLEAGAIGAIRTAWPAQALVLDLRGNTGGTTPLNLLRLLADRPLPWWRESSTAPQPARALGKPGDAVPPNAAAYRGRVVVLADERCVSSCEDLLMPLVVSRRARFVGARTAGSTGMPFVTEIAKGAALRVGSVHESFPDGKPFEGVGIAPTDPVPLTVADVRAHRDAQLARAVAIAEAPR
jgi:carboxyl-terminal processing protease